MTVPFLFLGCSVYKSQGRKNFESNSPSVVEQQPFQNSDDNLKTDLCWTQPRKDNLWNMQEGHLYIKYVSSTDMEVCLFPSEEEITKYRTSNQQE